VSDQGLKFCGAISGRAISVPNRELERTKKGISVEQSFEKKKVRLKGYNGQD
jgi:hypothetical protein